jgi:hypothetical protein
MWISVAGFLAGHFDTFSSGNKDATEAATNRQHAGCFSHNRRLKRQQGGNAVASLLPLLTDLKNRLEVLCLRLEGTQSKIFHSGFRAYQEQCRIRRNKLGVREGVS